MRIAKSLLVVLAMLFLTGCVRDQQAARTRLPGVDKKPNTEQPEKPEEPEEQPPEEMESRGG